MRFYLVQAMGATFPALAGMLLYGWRALAMLAVILPIAVAATLVWRKVGPRGRQLHVPHVV